MLALGVIEKSFGDWKSPMVLVPKSSGTTRFCIDFHKVNAVSKFNTYPMPGVDELFNWLGKVKYMTTLDLKKEYWQIPLTHKSREKTAFSTPLQALLIPDHALQLAWGPRHISVTNEPSPSPPEPVYSYVPR